MSTDDRRHPGEFLDEVREMRAHREQNENESPIDPAGADQIQAAGRDAHRFVREVADVVIDVDDIGEREEALMLALAAAADRRGLSSPRGLDGPRPELVDLTNGPSGRCDVCDTSAHRLHEMLAQYGPYVIRARVCVRCRRFAPEVPVDEQPDAA